MTSCIKIVSRSFLELVIEKLNTYTTKDRRYTAAAAPTTTSILGPSGSLIKKKAPLENTRADIANIKSEAVFDLNICILYPNFKIQRKMIRHLVWKHPKIFYHNIFTYKGVVCIGWRICTFSCKINRRTS